MLEWNGQMCILEGWLQEGSKKDREGHLREQVFAR